MAPDEYSKALDKALSDLQERVQQRDLLSAEIAGLRETVRVLSTLVKMPTDKQREVAKVLAMADYATPSLTDAIRSLLIRISPKEMTAIEVRNALEESSSSDDFSNSLSACHAALKRMLSDEEVETGSPKNGKTTYRRILTLEAPPWDSSGMWRAFDEILKPRTGMIPGMAPGTPVLPSSASGRGKLRKALRGEKD